MIKKLAKYIKKSNNIVFFGGAGISTESGIPDFRSNDGLYNEKDDEFSEYSPEYYLSNECLYNNPAIFYKYYKKKLDFRNAKPNIVHNFLTKLEEKGKLKAIITQNIDGLHQKAGSKNVLEIHGSCSRVYCSKCGKTYDSDFLYNTSEKIPKCSCRGLIRPDIVLYGEKLPTIPVDKASEVIRNADMLIVAGTSLSVYPAASFVYDFIGAHLVVINNEPLGLTLNEESDIFIQDNLGNVFSELNDIIK